MHYVYRVLNCRMTASFRINAEISGSLAVSIKPTPQNPGLCQLYHSGALVNRDCKSLQVLSVNCRGAKGLRSFCKHSGVISAEMDRERLSYKTAGVDIDAGSELVRRIAKMAPGIGGFGGLFPFGMFLPHTGSPLFPGFWLLIGCRELAMDCFGPCFLIPSSCIYSLDIIFFCQLLMH